MGSLDGKVAVITGGNSGIGLATARAYISEGATVIIIGRDIHTLEKAQIELGSKLIAIQVDVSVPSELDLFYAKIRKKFDKIDILFANAGIAKFKPVEQVTEEFFDLIFNTNIRGLFFTVQKAIPLLKNNASIILTGSSVANKGVLGASIYAASKAAVRSLGRSFAAELVGRGIRVNVISPGPVETPIYARMGLSVMEQEAMSLAMKDRTPLKRFGQPEEVAKVALFLASDDSSFIVGSQISVDGGVGQI